MAKDMRKTPEERKKWRSCASALKTRLAIRAKEEQEKIVDLAKYNSIESPKVDMIPKFGNKSGSTQDSFDFEPT